MEREKGRQQKPGKGIAAKDAEEAITITSKPGELFIVDNSISEWTGLRYLRDWTDIAKSPDIATDYFEIGSLLSAARVGPPLAQSWAVVQSREPWH